MRTVNTFDTSGFKIGSVRYEWDSDAKGWVLDSQDHLGYDEDGRLLEYTRYEWDPGKKEWIGAWRRVFVYDTDGNETDWIAFEWDLETNDWRYDTKEVSYMSALTSQISDHIIDHDCIVYPNPFTEYTTVRLSDAAQIHKIELIDMQGRIIRSLDDVNDNSVMIQRDNLPSGFYIIRIHSEDTYSEKVIIR